MVGSEYPRTAIAESDFLFGLRQSDSRHAKVVKALKAHSRGEMDIKVLSSAVMEVRAVLYSRGFGAARSEEALYLMDAILAEYGVREFLPLEMSDAVLAERLRTQEEGLGFFDSLHAAVAKRRGLALLSSEGVYARLGLAALNLDSL